MGSAVARIGWGFLLALASLLLLAGNGNVVRAHEASGFVVRVHDGALRGGHEGETRSFLGIPYAEPPVGDLRWRAPRPPRPWRGPREAREFSEACAQARLPGRSGHEPTSEDCLYLNIWTPARIREGERLPVMVWLHGGGLQAGSGSHTRFNGARLARKGVVLVTINYRLGVFGFMAHPELTDEAPYRSSGNYGILDQIAALQWVKANISAFGGDPRRITVFGQSAGSVSISILQASPLARGLFHRVIGQSTSQFDPDGGLIGRRDLRGAEAWGIAFAERLGATSIAQLRELPPERLLEPGVFFWATERDGHVLPDFVHTTFSQGQQIDVPTLVGSTAAEGRTIRMNWVRPESSEQAAYDSIYPTNALEQSATDAIQWQMREWATLQSRTGRSPVWLYWFDHAHPGKEALRAFHGSDVIYAFDNLTRQEAPWTEADQSLADLISSYWVNFARDGDPNGAGLPYWPEYDPVDPRLMQLSTSPQLIETPRPHAQEFLDRYFARRR